MLVLGELCIIAIEFYQPESGRQPDGLAHARINIIKERLHLKCIIAGPGIEGMNLRHAVLWVDFIKYGLAFLQF